MPNQCLGTRKCSPFDVLHGIPEAIIIIMDLFFQKKGPVFFSHCDCDCDQKCTIMTTARFFEVQSTVSTCFDHTFSM